ncbi:MAG: uracil-DNA glycosylase [Planctomycetes bacterium]|nr:uracil-DNA glycosylase [Planctomycetota bacterium]
MAAINLLEQLHLHLEALRAAGVLFVPRSQIAPVRFAPQPVVAPVEVLAQAHPVEVRRRELDVLAQEVAACGTCDELFSTRLTTVFGAGPLNAEVMFVGDAPGSDEDAQGQPFVGPGGLLLGRIVAACGFTRDRVYLMNVIKCRPPRNRAPSTAECVNCRDFFQRQFELVKPKHVVALGHFVSKLLAQQNAPLSQLRGTVHQYRGAPLICTHHPDDIDDDKTGRLKRETWDDMKLLLTTMGREVPKPS